MVAFMYVDSGSVILMSKNRLLQVLRPLTMQGDSEQHAPAVSSRVAHVLIELARPAAQVR